MPEWLQSLVIAIAMMAASASASADTGRVSGSVFNQHGQPVANAVVRISSNSLATDRSIETGANGTYLFDYLLPGEYTLAVIGTDLQSARRLAIVEIGKDTQVDFIVGLTVTEATTVTAARPVVDVRSTEASFNFNAEALTRLPLERTYRGLFQLIPGVPDNRSPVGPAAGGDRQDNTYLIDGVNITNPAFGYLSTEVNELDIAEVNLKRAGITAEFGRTGGTVTNAVSRSGTNRFSGLARIDWLPPALVAAYRLPDSLLDAGVRGRFVTRF